jgi:hypothetical protein
MNLEMKFLHCLDLSNKLKVLNLTSTATISSLLATQLFSNDKRDNPMVIDIEKLRNCTVDEINGMSSPRMLFVFQRTILNSWTHRQLTPSEEVLVHNGTLEIEFERGRRDYNYGAPSRLSCIYLMEDNLDSRLDLRSMFIDSKYERSRNKSRTHRPQAKEACGWGVVEGSKILREYNITAGKIQTGGVRAKKLTADYVLVYKGIKLAVVEAKSDDLGVGEGVAQAKQYAEKLKLETTYSTNGKEIYSICMKTGAEGLVADYLTPEQLWNKTFAVHNELERKVCCHSV